MKRDSRDTLNTMSKNLDWILVQLGENYKRYFGTLGQI